MGTAAYSIHCWLITRLYVFYHKRYGIDDTHRLTLLLRILYGFPCATRFPVPYRNNVISLVHHITIALVHTIRGITLLQERFFVAFGSYIIVPIPERLAPFLSLRFTRDGALKRNAIISRFQAKDDLSRKHINADCHTGDKVRNAILFNLPDYFISELLLECNTSFVCLIESKREALGSVAGKCTLLCLHISSLQLCILALFSFAYP